MFLSYKMDVIRVFFGAVVRIECANTYKIPRTTPQYILVILIFAILFYYYYAMFFFVSDIL